MVKVSKYVAGVLKRTREARKAAGYGSQEKIAADLGIERDRYAKYETERIINKELIAKFCELTGVSEKWLLSGGGPMKDDLMEKINQLHKDHLKSVEIIIDAYLREQEGS